jgi:hypothetical protein
LCTGKAEHASKELTSEANETLEATMTSMMKTSKRGNVTMEWTQHRKEFSLETNISR